MYVTSKKMWTTEAEILLLFLGSEDGLTPVHVLKKFFLRHFL